MTRNHKYRVAYRTDYHIEEKNDFVENAVNRNPAEAAALLWLELKEGRCE